MKTSNKKAYAFKRGAALAIAVVLFAGLAISCSNGSDSGGTPSITYVQVPYNKLDDYLTNQASETGINYIEITGAIPAADLKGSATDASALGKKLAGASPKKIGLKLPQSIEGLTDMYSCFSGCNNVVGLAAIPHGVTSIEDCFRGCTALQNAPIIPEGVTSMGSCFESCTALQEAPAIPKSVTGFSGCFFECSALKTAPIIPAKVTDMTECFYNCTALTEAPVIPAGVVNMDNCFEGCTALKTAPIIPANVAEMAECFKDCAALTGATLKCDYNDGHFNNDFAGCTSLTTGSIRVKLTQLTAYTNNATAMGTQADKFVGYTDETYKAGGVSFTMKGIEAVTNGTLGRDEEDQNKPHTVSLSAYYIGETEVTQELWQAVMGGNPSHFKGAGNPPDEGEKQAKRPVETISWYFCIAFCNELTKKVNGGAGSECVYWIDGNVYGMSNATAGQVPNMIDWTKKGFRLPTEAEWEWAAKGGIDYKWAGTDTESELKNYAWYSENGNNKTHEVKKKQPNDYGLYDMTGNVWEWCWDRYGNLSNSLPLDYTGAATGTMRVYRGGAYKNNKDNVLRAFRSGGFPDKMEDHRGLRVVCRP